MGIQSAKDHTRYSMGNHRRRRSTVECSWEVSCRALRRNSNREVGWNPACASVQQPRDGAIATKKHKSHKGFCDFLWLFRTYRFSISTGWIWSESVKPNIRE